MTDSQTGVRVQIATQQDRVVLLSLDFDAVPAQRDAVVGDLESNAIIGRITAQPDQTDIFVEFLRPFPTQDSVRTLLAEISEHHGFVALTPVVLRMEDMDKLSVTETLAWGDPKPPDTTT